MSPPAATLLWLQGRPGVEFDLDGLIQAAIVFMFIILPVLRSVAEMRKRRQGERPGPARRAGRRPADIEREGRDLWRELLGGGEPSSPPPPPAPPPAPPRRPVRRTRRRAAIEPAPAESLREVHRDRERQAASERAAALEERRAAPRGRAAQQQLGRLEVGADLGAVGRLEPAVAPVQVVDPATLDDEMARRWGGDALSEPGRGVAGTLPGGEIDWRQAVLLSELLSPALALRGPGSAWPGPPAALSR